MARKKFKHEIDEDDDFISKTQLKQEAEALQALGIELLSLNKNDLAKIPMDEDFSDALALAHRIRGKNEAYRRQIQYIGKLIRSRDSDEMRLALDRVKNVHNQMNAHFHKLEKLRDQLISEGDDRVQIAVESYPQLTEERQRLRQLCRVAAREQKTNKAPKAARELFKLLREKIQD